MTDPSVRNYKRERKLHDGLPHVMAKNRARKRARYRAEKAGLVRKGDGKEIHHKNGKATDNRKSNLQVRGSSWNRSRNKGRGGRPKGS